MKKLLALLALPALLAACGGGGGGSASGGSIYNPGNSGTVIYGPYETVYGAACQTSQPSPGWTFTRSTATRVNVPQDPNYNKS